MLQRFFKEDKKKTYILDFKILQAKSVIFVVCLILWDKKKIWLHMPWILHSLSFIW